MTDRDVHSLQMLDSASATGAGEVLLCTDQRNVVITFSTANSTNATIKIAGSSGNKQPDFSAAAAVGNEWDYVQVIDLEDGSAIDGDTGLVYSGTDAVRQVEVNTNGLDYLTVIVTAYSAGDIYARARVYNNQ